MAKTLDKKGKEVKFPGMFWLEGFEGGCHSGFYIRSDLFKQVERFEKMGHKVVGIRIEPGSWNLEFVCEKKDGT